MTDDVEPKPPATSPPAESTPPPAEPTPPPAEPTPTLAAPTPPPAAPTRPLASNLPPMPDLSVLDPTSRMIAGGAVVAAVVAILGGLLNVWGSTDFLLVVLAGGIAAAAAAWFTATTAKSPKPSPLPLASIELAGAAVAVVLGGMRLIELIFDLQSIDGLGGITDLVFAVVLAGAGVAMTMGVLKRDPSVARLGLDRDQATRIAAIGLILILAGWAINVSIGYWRTGAASLAVALATFAFVAIFTAPSWTKVLPGIPVAWLGAALGVVVALLAIGQWGSLGRLGETTELGIKDYVPFLLYIIGIIALIGGGAMTGQAEFAARPRPAAPEPPATPPAADATAVQPPTDPIEPPPPGA